MATLDGIQTRLERFEKLATSLVMRGEQEAESVRWAEGHLVSIDRNIKHLGDAALSINRTLTLLVEGLLPRQQLAPATLLRPQEAEVAEWRPPLRRMSRDA